MYNCVIWDLDGTICDSKPGITKCAQYALSKFGIEIDNPDDLTFFIGPPLIMPFIEVYGFDREKAEAAVKIYRERYRETGMYEAAVYPGIPELLGELRANGRRLAVATSKPRLYAENMLDGFGILGEFELVMGAELDGSRSAKDEVLTEVLRQLGIATAKDKLNAVLIGDTKYDIAGARECGIAVIAVEYGFAAPGELASAGPDYFAADIDALRKLLFVSPPNNC